ncbi:MAG: glycosyltransferase family 2 protein [Anaerolineales bacterium]|nr:glycosyltransferase family 2 protein [Anaerolineales bacterium]
MYQDLKITVVIPCLNEEDGISRVLRRIPELVDEVIVVDNNSTDRTAEVAGSEGATVVREDKRGAGRAYKTGLPHAKGDIIITLDGDHSYPVDSLSYLIKALLDSGVRFVSASRFPIQDKESMSAKHMIGNIGLSFVASLLFLKRIRDSQSGMWIFYRDALKQMNLVSDGMPFSEEIKLEAILHPDIGFMECPIRYSNRAGEIKLRPWRDGWDNLLFLFKKRISSLFGNRKTRDIG